MKNCRSHTLPLGKRFFLGQLGLGGLVLVFILLGLIWSGDAFADKGTPRPVKVVAYGDSLVAGYGLQAGDAFPAQLQKVLNAAGDRSVIVINGGVSGDTTASGLQRFDWVVRDGTDAVIVELGANDTLRGLDPKITRRNLDEILRRLNDRGIPVLLAGMRAARNWGNDHTEEFEKIYIELAKKYDAILYPFFLKGVALDPKLNLRDGLHPNPKGVARIVETILPDVKSLLERARARTAAAK